MHDTLKYCAYSISDDSFSRLPQTCHHYLCKYNALNVPSGCLELIGAHKMEREDFQ